MNKAHNVEVISITRTIMELRVDDRNYLIDLAKESARLAKASQKDLENFEVSPAGYGIHWPTVDEDLSIDGLIGVRHVPQFSKSKSQDY